METETRSSKPIRIDKNALDRWKAAVGVPLDDGAAANAAIRYATLARQIETQAAAKPDGE